MEAKGEARLGYSEGKFTLELKGNFLPGENEFSSSVILPIYEDQISAEIRGRFNNLSLLLPWKGAQGSINYLAEVKGPKASLQTKAAIDFQGPVLPLPKFAHAFRNYSGLMFYENNELSIRSLKAKLGNGDVQGFGKLRLGNNQVESMDIRLDGKNLLLSPLERTRALVDGSLNLVKDSERFVLKGSFSIQRLSWRREINEKFVFYSSPYYESEKVPNFFDGLSLNIRLKADDNAWMENSLGRIKGRFDLNVSGSVNAPVITGDIEAIDGNVFFQDRKFKVLRGRLSFTNPSSVEPYISFKGETYVKNYRVTFSVEGLLNHLNPEFTSSPPLPPEDVLALLALGESFQRTYSYDASTQLSTASLVSFQLSEEAKKRAEGLFVVDRFRIDPFVMGASAEMAARLTVGKKIASNFFIFYSTNLSSQREEIARLEWEISDDISIVGTRDEIGRISFDVKIHKRF
jgi:translocation and assembly module TamB